MTMWGKIKRFYWKQQLNRLETDMFISAISFENYIAQRKKIKAKIAELNN